MATKSPTPKVKRKGREDRAFNANGSKGYAKGNGMHALEKSKEKELPRAGTVASVDTVLGGVRHSPSNVVEENCCVMATALTDNDMTRCYVEYDLGRQSCETKIRPRRT